MKQDKIGSILTYTLIVMSAFTGIILASAGEVYSPILICLILAQVWLAKKKDELVEGFRNNAKEAIAFAQSLAEERVR